MFNTVCGSMWNACRWTPRTCQRTICVRCVSQGELWGRAGGQGSATPHNRPVDKRRAQKIQQKKRDDISDAEEKKRRRAGHTPMSRTPLSTSNEGKKVSSLLSATPSSGGVARKRKRGKVSGAGVVIVM